MKTRPVILIVDDEISNIEIMSAVLEADYEICFARSGEQAIAIAHDVDPDLILLDIVMPGLDGYEVCQRLKQDPVLTDVPIIFTSGLGATEDEVRGLSVGAIDYVTKPIQPISLRTRVNNHVELKQMRDRLADMAMTDPMTGLGNRRLLEKILKSEIRRLSRHGEWLSFVMLDIDFFKSFNDTYGHLEGDRCIRMVATALRKSIQRDGDVVARYGGEEFACILPGTDHYGALLVAEEMRRQVEQSGIPNRGSGVSPVVTVSVGVATSRCEPEQSMELWISNADRMLYRSKQSGRNQISGEIVEWPQQLGGAASAAG